MHRNTVCKIVHFHMASCTGRLCTVLYRMSCETQGYMSLMGVNHPIIMACYEAQRSYHQLLFLTSVLICRMMQLWRACLRKTSMVISMAGRTACIPCCLKETSLLVWPATLSSCASIQQLKSLTELLKKRSFPFRCPTFCGTVSTISCIAVSCCTATLHAATHLNRV